jgi:hypothetical protein
MTIFPGLDASGNSNNWTENNINNTDSTATTYDIMTDVPTLTDEDTANYCVMNPLDKNTSATISNGNLTQDASASAWRAVRSTYFVSSGKWYWETTISGSGGDIGIIGISNASATLANIPDANAYGYNGSNGQKYTSSTNTAYGATYASGDIIGIALDMDAGTLTFYKNNTSQGTAFTSLSGLFSPTFWQYAGYTWNTNFGQRPFAYTPPAGYLKLNTFNLPYSSIVDGSEYFSTVLYTGNGTSQSITGVNFQPDFTWIKQRSSTEWHILSDVIRGTDKQLFSNSTNAEQTDSTFLTSYNTDGFTVGTSTGTNGSGSTYVAWNWKANGTAVSNTDGTITSSVSANTTAGFSVVTYTGNTTAGATIGHGLGSAPNMIIIKDRDTVDNWAVYHSSLGGGNASLFLETTTAVNASLNMWNSTAPSSLVITLGDRDEVNRATAHVAYCFADVEGYSKINSYTGNGSTDGPFIYTGFRPAWIMLRDSTNVQNWIVLDTARNTYNAPASYLLPNSSGAEGTLDPGVDVLSNGFKMRTANSGWNTSSAVMIYMAFAENPFKNSLAR